MSEAVSVHGCTTLRTILHVQEDRRIQVLVDVLSGDELSRWPSIVTFVVRVIGQLFEMTLCVARMLSLWKVEYFGRITLSFCGVLFYHNGSPDRSVSLC